MIRPLPRETEAALQDLHRRRQSGLADRAYVSGFVAGLLYAGLIDDDTEEAWAFRLGFCPDKPSSHPTTKRCTYCATGGA